MGTGTATATRELALVVLAEEVEFEMIAQEGRTPCSFCKRTFAQIVVATWDEPPVHRALSICRLCARTVVTLYARQMRHEILGRERDDAEL